MNIDASFFCLGTPRFPEAIEKLSKDSGLQQAWRTLLQGTDIKTALASVAGSFAVRVTLDNGDIVIATDRFSIQPLCYRWEQGQLLAGPRADEIAGELPRISPQAIYDYLYFHAIPSPQTIFEDVRRLPAGHFGLISHGQIKVQPYWVASFETDPSPSFPALRDEFMDILKKAVAHDMGTGPAACFLSGGTDSSSVAGMLAQLRGKEATAYSIGFEANGYDEMEYARLSAQHFQLKHREYYVTPDDLLASIPAVAAFHDQPFGNSSALPAYYCAKMAHDDGVQQILAGDGGDELFGGNTRYAKQRIFGWYQHLPGFIRQGVMGPLLNNSFAENLPLVKKASSYVQQASVPLPDRLQMYNLLLRVGPREIFSSSLLSKINPNAALQQQQAVWAAAHADSELNRNLAFDWRYTLAESDLPKVRGACQMAGVGVGFPFLDNALVDFSMRLPGDYKLRGLKLRWFFKEAAKGFLHDDTLSKKKQGFGLPFGTWLNQDARLQILASESLRSLAARGVITPGLPDRVMKVLLPSHPGYFGELVWLLLMLEQWLQAKAPSFNLR